MPFIGQTSLIGVYKAYSIQSQRHHKSLTAVLQYAVVQRHACAAPRRKRSRARPPTNASTSARLEVTVCSNSARVRLRRAQQPPDGSHHGGEGRPSINALVKASTGSNDQWAAESSGQTDSHGGRTT